MFLKCEMATACVYAKMVKQINLAMIKGPTICPGIIWPPIFLLEMSTNDVFQKSFILRGFCILSFQKANFSTKEAMAPEKDM